MDLEERIRILEQQNRWFKRVGGVVLAVAVGLLILGQATPTKAPAKRRVVEAEQFVLRDKDGKSRGEWSALPDGSTHLMLKDKREKVRGMWAIYPNGSTGLSLLDKDEEIRGAWNVRVDGSTGLSLRDKDGKLRGSWDIAADGSTGLGLGGKDGKLRGMWGVDPDGTVRLTLRDKNGQTRAALGSASLTTEDTGTQTQTAESSLFLFDKNGRVLFHAP